MGSEAGEIKQGLETMFGVLKGLESRLAAQEQNSQRLTQAHVDQFFQPKATAPVKQQSTVVKSEPGALAPDGGSGTIRSFGQVQSGAYPILQVPIKQQSLATGVAMAAELGVW